MSHIAQTQLRLTVLLFICLNAGMSYQIKPRPHFDAPFGIHSIHCPEIRRHIT